MYSTIAILTIHVTPMISPVLKAAVRAIVLIRYVFKMAPHSLDVVLSSKWDRPYSRELAAYPAVSNFPTAVTGINAQLDLSTDPGTILRLAGVGLA